MWDLLLGLPDQDPEWDTWGLHFPLNFWDRIVFCILILFFPPSHFRVLGERTNRPGLEAIWVGEGVS